MKEIRRSHSSEIELAKKVEGTNLPALANSKETHKEITRSQGLARRGINSSPNRWKQILSSMKRRKIEENKKKPSCGLPLAEGWEFVKNALIICGNGAMGSLWLN